jgi:glycosyltransferase involved in cell wall biosynthesis
MNPALSDRKSGMKIVIATGIYPPDIGGHSPYTKSLKEALERQGHRVRLVLYGKLKKLPTGLRHFFYMLKLLNGSRGADAIIAFDTFSVAIPAAVVASLTGKTVFDRAGGDFVWEEYSQRTRDLIPLPEFYAHKDRWNLKERLSFRLIRWAMSQVDVVFSSAWQRDIWRKPYGFDPARTHVIENAIEGKLDPVPPQRKNFMFFTRQIALKNGSALRRAFAKAKEKYPDIELDEGVVSHDELLDRLRTGYAAVLPSISEVTPNYILEAIRCGKPFLLTKYSGYAERFKEYGVIVDPLDEEDMARGIEKLADEATYERLQTRIAAFNEQHTYDDIAREFVALIQKKI